MATAPNSIENVKSLCGSTLKVRLIFSLTPQNMIGDTSAVILGWVVSYYYGLN